MQIVSNDNKVAFNKGMLQLKAKDKAQGSRLCAKFRKEVYADLKIKRQSFYNMQFGIKPKNGLPVDRIQYFERKFKEYGITDCWGLA